MTLYLLLRLLVVAWWLGPDPVGNGPRTLSGAFVRAVRKSTFGRGKVRG